MVSSLSDVTIGAESLLLAINSTADKYLLLLAMQMFIIHFIVVNYVMHI